MDAASSALPSFEVLCSLASDDPTAFEALRARLIEDFIATAPPRLERRLRGLQFQIDGQRCRGRTDYASAQRVFAMMWESFDRLATQWQELLRDSRTGEKPSIGTSAKVLNLPIPAKAPLKS